MTDTFVPLSLNKIMQAHTYTVFVLKGADKRFAIYTTPGIGQTMQRALNGQKSERPSTHHLMHSIFKALKIKVQQVVIWDVHDTIYTARLFLEQEGNGQKQMLEIDARPSDCLSLAMMHHAPILCGNQVLEKVICIED